MELHENISPPGAAARRRLRRVVIEDPVDEQVQERIEEEHAREQDDALRLRPKRS